MCSLSLGRLTIINTLLGLTTCLKVYDWTLFSHLVCLARRRSGTGRPSYVYQRFDHMHHYFKLQRHFPIPPIQGTGKKCDFWPGLSTTLDPELSSCRNGVIRHQNCEHQILHFLPRPHCNCKISGRGGRNVWVDFLRVQSTLKPLVYFWRSVSRPSIIEVGVKTAQRQNIKAFSTYSCSVRTIRTGKSSESLCNFIM